MAVYWAVLTKSRYGFFNEFDTLISPKMITGRILLCWVALEHTAPLERVQRWLKSQK